MLARQRRIRRNRVRASAAGGIVVVVAAVAVVAGGEGGGSKKKAPESTTTSTLGRATSSTEPSGPSTTVPVASGDPTAPWRTGTLPADRVDDDVLSAWGRAKNRAGCRLLLPSEFGAGMDRPEASTTPINGDAGWEISFRQGASVVQVQGLFAKESRTTRGEKEIFSRRWSDGSVARYGPDARDEEEPNPDPETTAGEATLLLPDQDCAYVVYDTGGKSRLEFILEHLRFVEGTE